MSYQILQSQIRALENWNPKSQYISKNLQLKNKSLPRNCWQRFTALFRPSPSMAVAAAFADLYQSTQKYSLELASDQQTLLALRKVTIFAYSVLVQGKGGNKIRKTKARRQLASSCQNLNRYCKLNTKQSNSSIPQNLNSFKSLSQFIKQTSTKHFSIHQAQNYLETIAINFRTLGIPLVKNNPKHIKLANEILIFSRSLKKKFIKNSAQMSSEQKKFKKTYIELQSLILKQIFKKKLIYQTKELQALCKQYKLHPQNSEIAKFLIRCKKKNRKGKLYSLPVWYHFTRTDTNVASILKSNEIRYSHQGAYPGAFVSTKPEISYGSYGFCFSKQINKFACKVDQGNIKGPIISALNVNQSFPIYLGKKPPLKPLNIPVVQTWQQTTPQIWAGFQNTINFKKPIKSKDPISYYKDIRLSLFSYRKYLHSSDCGLKYFKQRRVQLMEVDNVNALMDLIHHTVYLHLKDEWSHSEVYTPPYTLTRVPHVISK